MKLLEMQKEGHRFHPLQGKKPMFPNWPESNPDQQTLQAWINQDLSIGWIQELTAALDFDNYELAREFWNQQGPFNCAIQKTRRGVHLVFRNPGHIGNAVGVNQLYDIRGNRGYLKYYGFIDGYDTTDPEKLDVFRDEWLPKTNPVVSDRIRNVRAYIAKIESIEGNNGSAGLMRAAAKCRDSGLSQAEALLELLQWNEGPTVEPSWSNKELARAITRAYEIYG
ncbi:MAG: bifunctional DNA primase/polymerase [Planctomycetota bacterium]